MAQPLNLQNLKPGKIFRMSPVLGEPMAVSSDGTMIAGKVAATVEGPSLIDVWSLQTGKLLKHLTIDALQVPIELVDFVQSNELLVMKNEPGNRLIQVWSISKGEPLRSWKGPNSYT